MPPRFGLHRPQRICQTECSDNRHTQLRRVGELQVHGLSDDGVRGEEREQHPEEKEPAIHLQRWPRTYPQRAQWLPMDAQLEDHQERNAQEQEGRRREMEQETERPPHGDHEANYQETQGTRVRTDGGPRLDCRPKEN
ncbi:MAG TPA: hypothetical protein VFU49_15160 [Ktedonobacteraceae bacterium]|nr:hypothetical protein [Ktedonobacteraceae bacterium]